MSKRYVTIVYEIVDDDAWSSGGNPLHYNHHGLQAVCASVGDLAAARDELVDALGALMQTAAIHRASDEELAIGHRALEKAQRGGG